MIKGAPLMALLAGAILLSPIDPARAVTTESTDDAGAAAAATDPDDQVDETANPNSATDGSATIDLPPIDMPGDSDDYTSPDEDDAPTDDPSPGN